MKRKPDGEVRVVILGQLRINKNGSSLTDSHCHLVQTLKYAIPEASSGIPLTFSFCQTQLRGQVHPGPEHRRSRIYKSTATPNVYLTALDRNPMVE